MKQRVPLALSATALIVAVLGSTPLGHALVAQVPRNSVGTLQLKRNAVNAQKLAPNAVRSAHVLNGSLLAGDFKSGQLPTGPKGDRGPQGERGPIGPPGLSGWELVRASTIVPPNTTSTAQARCPSGKRVIGGTASVQGVPTGVWMHTQVTLTEFFDVIATNTTAAPQQVNSTAICATVAM